MGEGGNSCFEERGNGFKVYVVGIVGRRQKRLISYYEEQRDSFFFNFVRILTLNIMMHEKDCSFISNSWCKYLLGLY